MESESDTSPAWIGESSILASAYALAERAHRGQKRPSDGRPFLDHVTEVATFLHDAGISNELVAVGLLHDSVERGTLRVPELRAEMGDEIANLVLVLTEDPRIESFAARKDGLRRQVSQAGEPAITVFAADKLSDIASLRRGIEEFGPAIEVRIGTTVESMGGHYKESVELVEKANPDSTLLPELHAQLDRLAAESSTLSPAASNGPAKRRRAVSFPASQSA
jgi:HD domain